MKVTDDLVQVYHDHLEYKNFSVRTIKIYCSSIRIFRKYIADNLIDDPDELCQVKEFLLTYKRNGKSWSSINNHYSALKIFFVDICKQHWDVVHLPRPRRIKKLPKILSKEDVAKIIQGASGYRNFALLSFLYGTGLRLAEAAAVKIEDIDGTRMQVRVNHGKGAKDRFVDIPTALLDILRNYYKVIRPNTYLFVGEQNGKPIAHRTIQHIFHKARNGGGVTKPCSVHTLRHCYATHHLEDGTDLVYLKDQMGHESIKTTAKYIHVCVNRRKQINHPIDSMPLAFRPPIR